MSYIVWDKHPLRLEHEQPSTEEEHRQNYRQIERWANTLIIPSGGAVLRAIGHASFQWSADFDDMRPSNALFTTIHTQENDMSSNATGFIVPRTGAYLISHEFILTSTDGSFAASHNTLYTFINNSDESTRDVWDWEALGNGTLAREFSYVRWCNEGDEVFFSLGIDTAVTNLDNVRMFFDVVELEVSVFEHGEAS